MFKKEFEMSVKDTHTFLNELLFENKIKIKDDEEYKITLSLGFVIPSQKEKFVTLKGPELNEFRDSLIRFRDSYDIGHQEGGVFEALIRQLSLFDDLKEGDDDFNATIGKLIVLKTCLVYWYCDDLKMFADKLKHHYKKFQEFEEELRKEKSEMNKLKREKKKEKKRQQKEASIPKKIRIRKSYLQPGMEEFKGQQIKKEIFNYDFQLDELGYL